MWPILLSALIVILGLLLVDFITGKPMKNSPPGPWRFPIFGAWLTVLMENHKYPFKVLSSYKDRYNSPVTGMYFGDLYVVVGNTLEACKEILSHPDIQDRPDVYPSRSRSFGTRLGLFFDDSTNWLGRKRQTFRVLRDFGLGRRHEAFESTTVEEIGYLVELITELCKDGDSIVVPNVFQPMMNNPLVQLLRGTRLPKSEHHKLMKVSFHQIHNQESLDATGGLLTFCPWLRFIIPGLIGHRKFHDSIGGIIDFAAELIEDNKKDYQPDVTRGLMDYLLHSQKDNPDLTDNQILMICADLALPPNTQAQVLTYALMRLIEDPNLQKECQQLIDDVVGRGRLPTLSDRENLGLIESTVRETLRVQDALPLLLPHYTNKDIKFMSYDIPKDTTFYPNMYTVNHDKDVWGDPENFRPQRFLNYKGQFDPKKDFSIPFGKGKRVCLGETFARHNIFLALSAVLQNFSVEEDTPINWKEDIRNGFALQLKEDFKIKFIPRN